MEVAFETIFLLPFYPHLHVLDRELCLKYYRGKKKRVIFICTFSYFSSVRSVRGSKKKNQKNPKQQPDSWRGKNKHLSRSFYKALVRDYRSLEWLQRKTAIWTDLVQLKVCTDPNLQTLPPLSSSSRKNCITRIFNRPSHYTRWFSSSGGLELLWRLLYWVRVLWSHSAIHTIVLGCKNVTDSHARL